MKKLFHIAWLIILLVITSPTLSQGSTSNTYQLRVPTANDYLTLLHDLLADDPIDYQTLRAAAQEIATFDYLSDNISYNDLTEMYYVLVDELQFSLNHNYWVRAIIETWLNTHPHELETNVHLSFGDFSMDVRAVDFLNDGQPEYILEIYQTAHAHDFDSTAYYDAYMIAYIDENGKYNVTETPMHYNLSGMTWQRDTWQTVHIEDINSDGKIEWVALGYGRNTGPGARSRASVLILVWNGTQLINIAPESLGFNNNGLEDVGWNYVNIDADDTIEIIETTQHYNSWGCSYQTLATFDWDMEQAVYVLTDEETIYPETVGCLEADAETAMWDEDFPTAISFYERAIALANDLDYPAGWYDSDIEQFQYIQARYTLALALSGQTEEALQQLQTLQSITPASDGIADIIELMVESYEPEQDSITLCAALYNYFIPYEYVKDYYYDYNSPLTVYVGFTLVDSEMFILNAYTPATRDTACDIDWLIASRLGEANFTVDTPPADVFASAGIPIREVRHFDISQDGIEDWLLWVEAEIIPFAFISDSEMGIYHLSRPNLPRFIEQSTFTLFDLPENTGTVLAWLSFGGIRDPYMGYCQNEQDTGVLTLWKLNDEFELRSFFGRAVCEQRTWDELIQEDGHELHLWVEDSLEPGGILIDAIYSWDNETSGYILTQPPPEYWEEMRTEYFGEESNLSAEISTATDNLRAALLTSEELEEYLSVLEEKLAGDTSQVDPVLLQRALYYQGLAFEAIGRTDNALETYVAIYESAPHTVWEMLAALHFEIVN